MSKQQKLWFYGTHTCTAILNNPERTIFEIVYSHPKILERLDSQNLPASVKLRQADKSWFDAKFGTDAVHQGFAICAHSLPDYSIIDLSHESEQNQLVIILDQVSDPHNVGAIIRSAAAFNTKAIVMTDRHAPDETSTLAKSASGALELVPMMRYANLAQAIRDLKDIGFWTYGFAESGSTSLGETKFSGKVALIMGAEGSGIRDLTRKNCDFLIRLETGNAFSTLNVSNAAAIAMYQVFSQFLKA